MGATTQVLIITCEKTTKARQWFTQETRNAAYVRCERERGCAFPGSVVEKGEDHALTGEQRSAAEIIREG